MLIDPERCHWCLKVGFVAKCILEGVPSESQYPFGIGGQYLENRKWPNVAIIRGACDMQFAKNASHANHIFSVPCCMR